MSTRYPPAAPVDPRDVVAKIAELKVLAADVGSDDEARQVSSRIAQLSRQYRIQTGIGLPPTPAAQAQALDPEYVLRPHITYLSQRIAQAVRDVERGKNRHLLISMPPRAGKTDLVSRRTPLWLLRRHPEWKIVLASYDAGLTGEWAKGVRTTIEEHPELGIALARDGGAGKKWDTMEGGGIFSTSMRGGLTGRGARVMIIDDPIKDFVDAHSQLMRQNLWDWWLSVAQTRFEPPYLALVVMTRWHEDDFVGRLVSTDHEGDPRDWERIEIPAIAEQNDVMGREPGTPLLSPLIEETHDQAVTRWDNVKRAVGSYTFASMYQQHPAPAKGAIFDAGWWRYWTVDPSKVTDDGRVVLIRPEEDLTHGTWIDSWDCSFGVPGAAKGSWVVGQRWARNGPNRYLISQQRGRWSFTETLKKLDDWARLDDHHVSPHGHLVHQRLIEAKANGVAIMDVLKKKLSGMVPIMPTSSKEARARAVTPEVESGNVYLPHPGDPGNEWVPDLLSELRNFPHDANDDQVDALTQSLSFLRQVGLGQVTVPGRRSSTNPNYQVPTSRTRAAMTDRRR